MKSNLLKKLYGQLCDFGLNSQEWIIRPVSSTLFMICHSHDPSFKLMGKIEQQAWAQIWLESI